MVDIPVPRFARELVSRVIDDEVPDLGAELAYRFLFAVFPFGIFVAALGSFVAAATGLGDPTTQIIGALGDNLPPDVAAQVADQLTAVIGRTQPGLLSIGAIGALWAATGGISSLMKAMNRALDVEETRPFLVKTGTAVGLTLLGSVGLLVAFVTIVGGSVLTEQAVRTLGIEATWWRAITLLRWPLVLALLAVAVAVLFRLGPNVRVSWRWALAGGAVFAIGWLVVTGLFALYVANFGRYGNTYGALGGVIVLMLWFYLTAVMLLLAAEVVAMLAQRREPHRVEQRRREIAAEAERRASEPGEEPRRDRPGRWGRRRPRATGTGAAGMAAALPEPVLVRASTGLGGVVVRSQRAWRPNRQRRGAAVNPVVAAIVVAAGVAAGAAAGLLSGRGVEDA